ncbi:MAG: dehydrogenase E1 component subunit alpha/beta [Chitinophagales bacterium]|nr:dehydrogenase E1 component subunit alpha/beta [Chitinophagales bacterium]MCO5281125.1 dehydrogenase E1 component subunit alpha/beta [Chitinophagales bacterium]OJV31234.1 MAG: dehydrogenase [Bacteroidetes bacterium 37-13]HRN94651.1 dehydrogenase E1 component subunit alpha/beta [Chitinophagales bacterium]HRP40462.1 dehydrogenase E1 component subunit alpha/beta [Chitinophagales bacterium]
MQFEKRELNNEELIQLYKLILKPRVIEERMLKLLRQGRVSKWFSGIGQEAISVGVTAALEQDEYVCPLHRNLGVFTTRNCSLSQLFEQFQGKKSGFSKGRERSFHFGTNEHHIVGMISHLGPQLCVGDGIALASKLKNEKKITVAFTGDGGTSEGDFHEACNIAAVWDLPIIILIENNGYGLSTPTNEQFRCKQLAERAAGYGMKGLTIDGNNILEVYHTVKQLKKEMLENPHPVILECNTFRMRGHEEASGVKYVPKELFEIWEKKDPVINYENWLIDEGIISPDYPLSLREEMDVEILSAFERTEKEPEIVPDTLEEVKDLFQEFIPQKFHNEDLANTATRNIRLVDAVSEGLKQSMQKHDNLVIMGQDVAEYGGVFKITEGFVNEFGKERVRNTPLCESGILSASLGMSVKGIKSVVEMQFADFVSTGFNAIVNNLAKSYWRWGQNADVVVRMPTGAGVGAGPFHSQSNEAWFFHVPGLKIVYPSSPFDAKGLLCAAIEDPNPIMFFEHKALYRGIEGSVPKTYYTLEIGKAKLVQQGNDISIITYGAAVHWAIDTMKNLNAENSITADILDLRTLLPFDKEAIAETVKKTGKVLILHEDTLTGGIGAEIAAWINENLFEYLDAPVLRCASLDTPVPFAIPLEQNFLAKSRLNIAIEKLLSY